MVQDPYVFMMQGETGCGKTHQMIERFVKKGFVYIAPIKTHAESRDELRWDGYSPKLHPIVWFKESKDWRFSMQYFNTLTDPVWFPVRLMGIADCLVRPKIIIIETNQHAWSWYENMPLSERKAFYRRFTLISRWLATRDECTDFFNNLERMLGTDLAHLPPAPPKLQERVEGRMRWLYASYCQLMSLPYIRQDLCSRLSVEDF